MQKGRRVSEYIRWLVKPNGPKTTGADVFEKKGTFEVTLHTPITFTNR